MLDQNGSMGVIEWVNLGLGLWGSTLATGLAVRQFWQSLPRLKVTITLQKLDGFDGQRALFTTYSKPEDARGDSEAYLIASATNHGEKEISIRFFKLGILGTDDSITGCNHHPGLPCKLAYADRQVSTIQAGELAGILKRERNLTAKVRLFALYRDTLGKTHRSKPFAFDPEMFVGAHNEIKSV